MKRLSCVFVFAFLAACGTTNAVGPERFGQAMGVLETKTEGAQTVEMVDLNGDRQPDVWKVSVKLPGAEGRSMLIRRDLDVNFDGRVDIRRHYDASGEVEREEMDRDFDRRVDAVHCYRNGALYMSEIDMAFDGQTDVWKFYDEGELVRKERDLDGDSIVDSWEYWKSGRLVRKGSDRDGDGEPEYFEDAPED